MRKKIKPILLMVLILTLIQASASYGQWRRVYSNASDIYYVSKDTVWAIGISNDGSTLITKSVDAGHNWSLKLSIANTSGKGICFVGQSLGFVVGLSSTEGRFFYKTTDGGENWIKGTVPPSNYMIAQNLKFFDSNNGFSGSHYTTNGGTSWMPISSPNGGQINDFQFFESNTGFACFGGYNSSPGVVVYTTDKGITWTNKLSLPSIYWGWLKLIFTSPTTGYALAQSATSQVSRIYKTTDAGQNWNYTELNFWARGGMDFTDSLSGFIMTEDTASYTYRTNDGGTSWQPQMLGMTIPYYGARQITAYDKMHATIVNGSHIMVTRNGGEPGAVEPDSVVASATSGSSVVVTWSKASYYPIRYCVYRSQTSNSGFTQIDSVDQSVLSYSDNSVSSGATYWYKIASVNGYGVSPLSVADSATTSFSTISFSTTPQISPSSAIETQAVTVSVGITGSATSVTLTYGKTGQALVQGSQQAMNLVNGKYEATIPSMDITNRGLWYHIKAQNPVTTAHYPSETGVTNLTITLSNASINTVRSSGAYPNGLSASSFHTVSVPFNANIALASILGEQTLADDGNPSNWRVLTYTGGSIGQFTDANILSAGQGYLIYQSNGENIFLNITSASTNNVDAFNNTILPAGPGWNLVPWPHAFSANLTVTDNSKIGSIWQLNGDGGWQQVSQAKPFAGYAIYNKTSSPVTLGNVISWTGASKAVASVLDWRIQIKAGNGKSHDDFNFVGVSASADDEEDIFDEADPMAVGKSLRLSMISKLNNNTVRLSTDAKNTALEGHTWEFIVKDETNKKPVTLEFIDHNVPFSFEKKLVDISNNKIVDLQSYESYAFLPQNDNRFKLVVGTTNYVNKTLEKISSELPQSFSLSQNYPNPFNPTTTIKFALPVASKIEISIYNVLGQVVRKLVDREYATGYQFAQWDGKDNHGNMAASGVYIYRLTARSLDGSGKNFTKSQKMLLMK